MNQCPNNKVLNDLLLGLLPKATAEGVTEHLGSCERCQSKIKEMSSGDAPVESLLTKSAAANPPQNSAFSKATNVIDQQDSEDLAETKLHPLQNTPVADKLTKFSNEKNSDYPNLNGSDSSSDSELSFLEPCEDPAYIGCLKDFQISRVIGRGGMGVVLEAFDPHLQRVVAIKVLSRGFQNNKGAVERFCREGRAAASVSHEHVVPMYQVARIEEGEIAFLVMQLIDGETLQSRLEEQSPMPSSEVARIGMQIAAGLSAAHEMGLVHRDIKPGNVLIEKSTGRVKLTDFGLARSTDDIRLTQTGMLVGTALYMSPEQALGNTIDERSDLFSLGAVMYEMATGRSAFEAPTAVGVIKQIMDEQPPSPRKVNPQVGNPMSDLIMKLLSKKPEDRPDSAGQVARALASIVSDHGPISPLQVPAVSSSTVKNLTKRSTFASRVWAWSGWVIATLLLGTIVFSTITGRPLWMKPKHHDDPISVVFNSKMGPRNVTPEFPSVVLGGNPGAVWSVSFSPDGKTIAAGVGDGSVRLWDIDNQKVIRSFNAHDGNVWDVQFHPKLNLVATAGDDAWIKLWDASTFELKHGWKADNSVRGMAFSPDNKVLVAGDRGGRIHVYDIETGEEVRKHSHDGAILGLDFSPDGKSIVTVGSDKTVRVFDATTFEVRQNLVGHEGPIYNVAFSHEGPFIASVGWKSDVWVWNSETGENVLKLDGDGGDNWGVSFLGKRSSHLVVGNQDGSVMVWRLENGRHVATFHGHSAPVHDIALDRERKRIATSSRDGTIRIWDTEALKELTNRGKN